LRSAFRYADDVRRLVHAFKYGGQSSLATALTGPMLHSYVAAGFDAGIIVAVPMTGMRERSRGYNQAGLLARELAQGLGIPLSRALRRRRFLAPQARSSSAEERRRNVQGAFDVLKVREVADRAVLLVDDIATTGATLDACARALLEAGAGKVTCLTLARED
jgi:ComF family protein